MGLPVTPDLFGYVPPPREPVVRRQASRQAEDVEQQFDELHGRYIECMDELRRTIECAIETFSMAMVDYQNEDNAGDIDRLIEELDEEITDALREARRGVAW